LGGLKSTLVVDEAIFLGVERRNEIIFFILCIEKSDLDEVP
jgi:hypothetical protein